MKCFVLAFLLALPLLSSCSPASKESPVVDADSAVAAAKKSWPRIYDKTRNSTFSKESTEKFEPYIAQLEDGVWIVRGTVPADYRGEVLETTIRQNDGTVSVKAVQIK